ncbi:MAG: hypothetical protein DRR16_10390 [Candidatus Parabeggiatoa sp. nov. 3]|nr:MAG: hypothetical protein DRR00_17035 [Gammaproteobacteria bacterium]RKZ67194.1 MAG: hypothetical protein DRQ99_07360 [Gammaproteobacteria bacterium]RKZ86179.1 MAG: hypothetical protein DRR16_10390 [Gammaproteobacteria bacterium]
MAARQLQTATLHQEKLALANRQLYANQRIAHLKKPIKFILRFDFCSKFIIVVRFLFQIYFAGRLECMLFCG